MRARQIAVEHVLRSQQRLRSRLDNVPSHARRQVADAVREYAKGMMPIDVDQSLGLEEVVAIIDVPPAPKRGRDSAPPDDEGDEQLLQRRGKLPRWGW